MDLSPSTMKRTVKAATATAGLAALVFTAACQPLSNINHGASQGTPVLKSALTSLPQTLRIDAGRGAYTDGAGNKWSADTYSIGGQTYQGTRPVAGTTDDQLFQGQRYGMSGYRIPVANGTYDVKLYMAEVYWNGPGQRIFSVTAQGQPFLTNFDLYKTAGPNTAYVATKRVTVTNGAVQLGFSATKDNAMVSGIEVVPVSVDPQGTTKSATTPPVDNRVGDPTPAPTTAPPNTTPTTPATGPTAAPPASASCSGGVSVAPGANVQAIVNNAPAGTKFQFAAGTFGGVTVDAKAGDTFCGAGIGKTILDGGGVNSPAIFAGSGADANVTVTDFTIRNYRPQAILGAVDSNFASNRAKGWQVLDNDINHNSQVGVSVGDSSKVIGNYLNDNGRYGLTGGGANSRFSYNEIARNNANHNDTGDAGGTKFAISTNLVVDHNWVHNNLGPGLWTDINNVNTTYDSNLVEGNSEAGIFHEISYKCTITNNTLRNNGAQGIPWVLGAGIEISNSQGCTVSHNYLEDNANGLIGIESVRGGDSSLPNYQGTWNLKNNTFSDNYVKLTRGVTGVAGNCTPNGGTCIDPTSGAANNDFTGNHYYLSNSSSFSWGPGIKNFQQFQSSGQDTNGNAGAVSSYTGAPKTAVGPAAAR